MTTAPGDDGAPGLIGWVDPVALAERAEWARDLDPDDLDEVLAAAFEQCEAYLNGRVPTDPTTASARLRLAQTMQARALVRSAYVGGGDQSGIDGMSVTVFPMDWTVKNLLRPRRAGRGPR